jgi:uncharacterized protein YijF (DUF1287 family)
MIIHNRRQFLTFLLLAPQALRAETPQMAKTPQLALLHAARKQIGVTLTYDPAYTTLAFPNGDVPREKGVCTDVLIRAYRDAFNIDFQSLIHKDMQENFSLYPKKWGLKAVDKNIDHRRVLNLQVFLKRQGAQVPQGGNSQAGDIVTQLLPGNLPHIVIISDKQTKAGTPLVIHNIGAGTREEDSLLAFKITGHYRYFPK